MNWGQITIYAKLNSRQRLVSFTSVKSYVWSSAGNSRTCCFAGLPLLACLRFIASYAFLLRRVCSRLTFPLEYVWEQVVMVSFHSTCLCDVCMGCHGNLSAPVRLCLLPSSTWSMLISTDGFLSPVGVECLSTEYWRHIHQGTYSQLCCFLQLSWDCVVILHETVSITDCEFTLIR